ncbi:MAG: hypothetical protein OHK0044_14290 [Burkholderiaceae bacterium]
MRHLGRALTDAPDGFVAQDPTTRDQAWRGPRCGEPLAAAAGVPPAPLTNANARAKRAFVSGVP